MIVNPGTPKQGIAPGAAKQYAPPPTAVRGGSTRYTDTFCNAVDCRFELALQVQRWTGARSECLPVRGGGKNYSHATASLSLLSCWSELIGVVIWSWSVESELAARSSTVSRCPPPEYQCSMSSIVCGSGRPSVSGSSSVSRPAAVDRPPNNRPGNHGNSFAYTPPTMQ